MLNCTIYRTPSTSKGTFGVLFMEEEPFCVTVERSADGDHPCIPAGTYECDWFHSPHNGWCYLLKDTYPRTMIEMHAANMASQLLGCIAPGRRFGALDGIPAVLESGPALSDLHKALGDSFILTIKE